MLKKILAALCGLVFSLIEFSILGSNPMQVISTIVVPVGFVFVFMSVISDFVPDRKITIPMIVCYLSALAFVAIFGVAMFRISTFWFILSLIALVGAVAAYFVEKKGLMNKLK